MSCRRCGRAFDRADQRFCGQCGEPLAAPPERDAHGDGRIAAVYRHADWSLLRGHEPSSRGPATGMALVSGIGLVFALAASGLAFLAWRRFEPPVGWQWAVIGAAVLFSVVSLAWGLRSAARLTGFLGAELERVPVIVVDEQSADATGDGRSRGRPVHHVTLEDERGHRSVEQCTARVAALVTAGDLAVAYRRGGVLLDLVRVVPD